MGELIQTRVMRAAGFASIVRRTVFAVFSKKVNPKIIARDVALLNRQIFDELVNKGIKKEDYIRVSVEGEYDEEKQAIEWKNLNVVKFIPETDLKELTAKYNELEEETKKLAEENTRLKAEIQALRKTKEEVMKLKEELKRKDEDLIKLKDELKKALDERRRLEREVNELREAMRAISKIVSEALGRT